MSPGDSPFPVHGTLPARRLLAALLIALVFSAGCVLGEDAGRTRAREALEHLELRPADLPQGWTLLPDPGPLPGEEDFRKLVEGRILSPRGAQTAPPEARVRVQRVADGDGRFPVLLVSYARQEDANEASRLLKEAPPGGPPVSFLQGLSVIYAAPARRGGFASLLAPMVKGRVGKDAVEKAALAVREKRWEDAAATYADLTWAKPNADLLTLQAGCLVKLGRFEEAVGAASRAKGARDIGSLPPEAAADLEHFQGVALAASGRSGEARAAFEEGIRRTQSLAPDLRARALYDLAGLHARAGERAPTLAALGRACESARAAATPEWCAGAAADRDFSWLREDAEFRRLTGTGGPGRF